METEFRNFTNLSFFRTKDKMVWMENMNNDAGVRAISSVHYNPMQVSH